VRRADAVRAISGYTTGLLRPLGVEPAAVFPAYVDLSSFVDRPPEPLPSRPRALFVGVLEPYKGVDVLAEAWRLAAPRVPDARLLVVGEGPQATVVERLVAELPEQTEWAPRLAPADVARELDRSSLLVLASRSEGLPRIVIEAFCRGRPVVGTRAGGTPDIVEEQVSGLLVPPEDPRGLADALVAALGDRTLLERLAAGAAAAAGPWLQTPEEFAARTRELVEHALR
jgi:glycosyltransferase involved in cell wall biosynthesis